MKCSSRSRSRRASDRDHPGRAIEGPRVVEREEQPVVAERHQAVEPRQAGRGPPGISAASSASAAATRVQRGVDRRWSTRRGPGSSSRARARASRSPPRSGADGRAACAARRRGGRPRPRAWASRASSTFGDAGAWTARGRGGAAPAVCGAATGRRGSPSAIAKTAANAAPDVASSHDRVHSGRLPDMTGAVRSGRVLALDIGRRRTGLAISDADRHAGDAATASITAQPPLAEVLRTADQLAGEADGLSAIVVGRPLHLDGRAERRRPRRSTPSSPRLRTRTALPVFVQDERLSSVEAESRLAVARAGLAAAQGAARRRRRRGHPAGLPRLPVPAGAGRRESRRLMRALVRLSRPRRRRRGGGAVVVRSLEPAVPGLHRAEDLRRHSAGPAVSAIGHRLVEAGVVKSDWAFRLAVWRRGAARTLKAGEYRFTGRRGRPTSSTGWSPAACSCGR